ncbi:MAG: AI-2E family transporter [Gemmatimonadota bacterium]|nr:AI-2E family transporter [Gemmatimonadota bacterium]
MSDRDGGSAWPWVQTAAVVLVLGFFLFSTRSILNPVFLFLLFWGVMLPHRGRAGYGALLGIAGVITLVWLLSTTGTLLAPFVLAVVLAYVLDPLVDWMQERRIPRTVAILLLALPALGALGLLLFVAIPAAARQVGTILSDLPVFFARIADWIEASPARLGTLDVPLVDEEALLTRLRAVDGEAVVAFLEERRADLGRWIWEGVLGLGRGIGSAFTVLGYVALTPVLTFYLLRDWDRITARLAELVPEDRRDDTVSFAREGDRLIARYLRGQVTVAAIVGLVTGLGLWAVSFPYAATLGLIVAVFSIVPYLGLVLSLAPAILIALVSGSVALSLLKVAVVYAVAQGLEGTVISPRIVGESVGLHPVWVVLALALGGYFFGFVGLLIGVPAAAMGKLLVLRALERYRASDFYGGEAASEEAAPV